jgi:hypothetical protein
MIRISYSHFERVSEDRCSFLKRGAVFPKVEAIFDFVPLNLACGLRALQAEALLLIQP